MAQKVRLLYGTAALLFTVSAIVGIYYITVLFSNTNAEKDGNEPPPPIVAPCNENITFNEPCYGLSVTRRYEWLAQPPKRPINKLKLPTERIFFSDTGSPECLTKPECLSVVRNIQEEHIRRQADDIEYNFLMDTKGRLYEGRGWMLENGQSSDDFRKNGYWIAFIGSLTTIPNDDVRRKAMNRFLDRAVSVGNLNVTYQVFWLQDSTDLIFLHNVVDYNI